MRRPVLRAGQMSDKPKRLRSFPAFTDCANSVSKPDRTELIDADVRSTLPYDPAKDFTPIAQLTTVPMIWVGSDKLPAKSMQEFVAYSKSHPDEVTVGHAALISQVAIEQLSREQGLKFRLVPYKSGVDVTKALLSGDIDAGLRWTYPSARAADSA